MFRFTKVISTIALSIVMALAAIGSATAQSEHSQSNIIVTAPCVLTPDQAAIQLTGDVSNAQFFNPGYTDESVWYSGPKVWVHGQRDIVIYTDNVFYGPYVDYGTIMELSEFHAFCQKTNVSVSEEYVGSCYNGDKFVEHFTGSLDGWNRIDQYNWHYSGDPVVIIVPEEATIKVWQTLDESTSQLLFFGARQTVISGELDYTCPRNS